MRATDTTAVPSSAANLLEAPELDREPSLNPSQTVCLPSAGGQPREIQASVEISCTLTVLSSLFVSHGTSQPMDQSSDAVSQSDPLEQIFVCLNKLQNQIHNIQAVVSLPKGLPS